MTKRFVVPAGAVLVAVFGGFIFVHANRLGWTLGWIYMGMVAAALIVNLVCLLLWNPELIWRHMRVSRFAKAWDKVWAALSVLAVIAFCVVAVREARDGVLREPGTAWLLGFAIFSTGWALAIWSMAVNPFFEKTVRIQTEHGHRVIDTGPYSYVRHPGYVGFLGWIISTPLLLASPWAFIPALITALLLVIRTALEDRTLRDELPGYIEYANRVRFRLIPGLW